MYGVSRPGIRLKKPPRPVISINDPPGATSLFTYHAIPLDAPRIPHDHLRQKRRHAELRKKAAGMRGGASRIPLNLDAPGNPWCAGPLEGESCDDDRYRLRRSYEGRLRDSLHVHRSNPRLDLGGVVAL